MWLMLHNTGLYWSSVHRSSVLTWPHEHKKQYDSNDYPSNFTSAQTYRRNSCVCVCVYCDTVKESRKRLTNMIWGSDRMWVKHINTTKNIGNAVSVGYSSLHWTSIWFFTHPPYRDIYQYRKTICINIYHKVISTILTSLTIHQALLSEWVGDLNFSDHCPSWGRSVRNFDYMRGTSWVIYMLLNYTFHYILNTGMNHISPLYCRRTPPACLLDPFQGLCVPTGCNLLQCYVQCVLMKQKGSSML